MPKDQNTGDGTVCTPYATLLEVGNKDLWQSALIRRAGYYCGYVIRQLVEPCMYTIRYIIVYDETSQRHIPIPASTIQDITPDAVFCNADAALLLSLPSLAYPFERTVEEQVHRMLSIPPYWVEEAQMNPDTH